jgi:Uma2 family endonuclease
MATSTTLVPLEEYLNTTYEPDAEWVDGELKERAVGEGSHAYVQTFFIRYFLKHEDEFGIRVTQELRMQVSAKNYRVPDVTVIRSSDPFEEIVRTPPLLCIEILSPTDSMSEMQDKIDDYLTMGVKAVWVVNPKRRKAFLVDGGALLPAQELTVPGTTIRVGVKEIFAGLDELQARSGLK